MNNWLYVVTCYMQGCDECGDEYHVVGVYSTEEGAKEAERRHEADNNHVHSFCTSVERMELDKQ